MHHGLGRRGRLRLAVLDLYVLAASAIGLGCHDVLSVPIPAGQVPASGVNNANAAQALRGGALTDFAQGVAGVSGQFHWSGELADEFANTYPYSFCSVCVEADARQLSLGLANASAFDITYTGLQATRLTATRAIAALRTYMPSARAQVAELFALSAYVDALLAEDVCSGVPLSTVAPGGGAVYGVPLRSDSLLGVAAALFDSATVNAGDSVLILQLAAIGKARTLIDRGQYAQAASLVGSIPAGYTYAVTVNPQDNLTTAFTNLEILTVADRKGANGLPFVTSGDPRMPIDSSLGAAPIGTTLYYPAKFPKTGTTFPVATGTEASLMLSEASLPIHGGTGSQWLTIVNALRTDGTFTVNGSTGDTVWNAGSGGVAGLAPLTDPGDDASRVDLLFNEKAFWLFGMGERLSDLRRLVRQYGRDAASVFPSGQYGLSVAAGAPFSSYGAAVSYPLGAIEQANPNFHGCLNESP